MITSHTERINDPARELSAAVRLAGAGKKYPFGAPGHGTAACRAADFWALADISLEAGQGQVLGVIGRNGAGKTTLLNLIAGNLTPTEGSCSVKGRVLGLFNLGIGFQDELSGKENIFLNGLLLGASRSDLEKKLEAIIDFSELNDFIDMPLGTYSQGMRLRLGFSIIANLEFDVLVIDEVLAVGDSLFQNKCFQRLTDFKHAGKTLILTSQNLDLIERLCDRVVLLNHGRLLYEGPPAESVAQYRRLLASERFFVGPDRTPPKLFCDTKKWADDVSEWGSRSGTREVFIESVEFINRFGLRCVRIKSGQPLTVRVFFKVLHAVQDPHFGVAIFRDDGVYCYGPNTSFDGKRIPELKPGRGYFTLSYKNLNLAAGSYRVSVAIWDRKETVAYDYHNGMYPLKVAGRNDTRNPLLALAYSFSGKRFSFFQTLFKRKSSRNQGEEAEGAGCITLFDARGQRQEVFKTNALVRARIAFPELGPRNIIRGMRLDIFRSDGIFCQGVYVPQKPKGAVDVIFPRLALLPGRYVLKADIGGGEKDRGAQKGFSSAELRMVFDRPDHGTVYLEHDWRWKVVR